MNNQPIGVFDSGVGGLTVTSAIMKTMPNENIIYFGDTARVPYGNKSSETVTKFAKQIIRFLQTKNVKAIIVACNTVSAVSLKELRREFEIPIFGVVEPGVFEAKKTTKNKRIGIIGTCATINSGAYKKLICEFDEEIKVFSKACPLFVPLAEEGWTDKEATKLIAEEYLKPLISNKIDTLVLGCTHYPLLRRCIEKIVGENVKLVDPSEATACFVKEYLKVRNMLNESYNKNNHSFFVSDTTDKFEFLCSTTLDKKYSAEKINIENY